MLPFVAALAGAGAIGAAFALARLARAKNLHLWLAGYLGQSLRRRLWPARPPGRVHVLFCLVDHFEPVRPHQLEAWVTRYPTLARSHRDSGGRPPRHTWFVPGEQYRPEVLDALTALAREGLGEVELHLHHGHDTRASLRAKIEEALESFRRHGALLSVGDPPVGSYGFIHGNMALDNSMQDDRFCGVDSEIGLLVETGCYADFGAPTAPAISQTSQINSIYYAIDDPVRPKSHDSGAEAGVGTKSQDGLLIVQGPLALDWRHRKMGVLPRIDNAEITGNCPGRPDRVARWVSQRIHVRGRPDWIVVKASCHGAEEANFEVLLGRPADEMYATLEAWFRDRNGFHLHYVTTRELYNIIKAAEAGHEGNPDAYRDFVIAPYRNRGVETGSHD